MNILKTSIFIFIFTFFFTRVTFCQDTSSINVKFILSENFSEDNFKVIDFSVRSNFTQFGHISTYIGFTTNKPLSSFLINLFDRDNSILYQTDDYYRSNGNMNFKNTVYVYHCYIPHIDCKFIKTIVIEKD